MGASSGSGGQAMFMDFFNDKMGRDAAMPGSQNERDDFYKVNDDRISNAGIEQAQAGESGLTTDYWGELFGGQGKSEMKGQEFAGMAQAQALPNPTQGIAGLMALANRAGGAQQPYQNFMQPYQWNNGLMMDDRR